MKIILTIAGSDSSGAAGIQTDLKTIQAFDCFGMSVITAITAQNSSAVSLVEVLPLNVIEAQFLSIVEDYEVAAIKIGMVGRADVAALLGRLLVGLEGVPIVLDTPLVATTGVPLGEEGVGSALAAHLFPLSRVVTPNLDEAAAFLDTTPASSTDEMLEQARQLTARGAGAILLKGGHLLPSESGGKRQVRDVLVEGVFEEIITGPFVDVPHRRGTGCALSTAIACQLGQGMPLINGIRTAKSWLTACLLQSGQMGFGEGDGPVNISKLTNFES